MVGGGGGGGGGGEVCEFIYCESKFKIKKIFLGGRRGEGARVSGFFYKEFKLKKTTFFFFFGGGGGGSGRRGD